MERDLRGRIAIATMCAKWKQIADEYDLPIELDHYCQAQNLDDERADKVAASIEKDLKTYRAMSLHGPFNELFPHPQQRRQGRSAQGIRRRHPGHREASGQDAGALFTRDYGHCGDPGRQGIHRVAHREGLSSSR